MLLFVGLACTRPVRPPAVSAEAASDASSGVAIDFDDPESCAPCHGVVVAEWKTSMHARSHHEKDPIYGTMRTKRMQVQGEQIAEQCNQCHIPRAVETSETSVAFQSVSCSTCHAVSAHDPSQGMGARAFTWSEDTLLGPNDLAPGASPVHGTGPAPSWMTDGRSLCLTCHDATSTPTGAAACTTGPEHTALQGDETCTSCHMPTVEGPSGALSRHTSHASHAFLGPHHAWYHDDASFMATAVDLGVSRDGEGITVTLDNRAGHAFPTGFPGRMAVVVVEGFDAAGQSVWKNITGDPMQESPESVLGKVYVDAEGKPVPAPFSVELRRDSRLEPGEKRTLRYAVPPTVEAAEARLVFRLLPPPLAESLGIDGVEAEPRVIATASTP